MKRLRSSFWLLAVGCWLSALNAFARPYLHDLSIRVVLSLNGDARITETRHMDIDSEGTECYIGLGNMGGSEVRDLTVHDETGLKFDNIGKWDIDRSRSWKAGRCGIVYKRGGYELCWGLGDSGDRTYVTSYTITSLVHAYPDADAIRHVFLDEGVSPKPQHAIVTIVAEDDSTHFTAENCGIWGFRFHGTIDFVGDSIVAETTEAMEGGSGLYVMVRFDKGMFQPTIQEDVTFEQKQQEAFEGSDYNSDGGDDDLTASEIFFMIIFLLIGIGMPVFAFVYKVYSVWRFRKRVNRDLLWYRDIPLDGNLPEANNMLNAYRYVSSDYNNLLSACILKLVDLGAITIEPRPNKKGKTVQSFVIHELENQGSQPLLVRKMHNIFKLAAGDDTVLEPWELKSFMKSNRNSSITDSFLNTLHVKSDVSKYSRQIDEVRKVFGLKKFLKEFSLLDERHVSEVGLWKDYMIYATLFGIADQVIKDMKKINPAYFEMDKVAGQMADDMTIPMIYSTMHNSTARAVANKAAREARASGGGGHTSWGGGGGGFSGGGFGGGVR
ncbi:MAG: DUF2207 domain-containing protein [Prevotella sp.]|jgi:uncharacterized membrane protein YgcG|nr:DUF2207 domain-containing protein [Prevotella sp.]